MKLRTFRLLAFSGVFAAVAAQADYIYHWADPSGVSTNWNTAGNWTGYANHIVDPHSYLNVLDFDHDADGVTVNNVPGGVYLSTLNLANQAWKVQGGDLHFAAISAISSAGGASEIDNDLHLDGADGSGGQYLTANVSAGTLTLYGGISGLGGLAKGGAGTLVLEGSGSYTGGTAISAGTLALGASNALPSGGDLSVASGATFDLRNLQQTLGSLTGAGNVNLGAGKLNVGNAANATFTGAISGTGSLFKEGAGTLTLSGNETYTGPTTIDAGTLRIGGKYGYASGSLLTVRTGATLDVNGGTANTGGLIGAGSVILGTGGLVTGGSGASSFTGMITGSGALTGTESGTQTITSALAGLTRIDHSGSGTLALSGAIGGTGYVWQRGSGTLLLSGTNSYTGGTTISAGTLRLGANGALPGSGNVAFLGGTLDLSGNSPTVGDLNFGDGTVSLVGGIKGTGTLHLNGNVTLNPAGSYADGNFNSSTPGLSLTQNIVLSAGDHTVQSSNGRYSSDFYDVVLAGALSGAGGLKFLGSAATNYYAMLSPSTYAGATTIGGGVLYVGAANVLPSTTALTVASGAEFDLPATLGAQGITPGSYAQTVGGLSGGGVIVVSGTTLTVGNGNASSAFSGSFIRFNYDPGGTLAKVGTGRLDLTQASLGLLDALQVKQGTVALSTGSVPATTLQGGTLEIAQNMAGTLDARSISGTGPLLKTGTGTVTVAGALASTLSPTIAAGTLAGVPSAFTHAVVGKAGATFQIDAASPGFLAAGYSGAGDFLKTGAGQVLLGATLANTGATTVQAGSLDATAAGTYGSLSLAAGTRFINDSAGRVEFTLPVVTQGEITTEGGATTAFDKLVHGAGGFSGFGEVDFNGGYSPGNSPAAVTLQGDVRLGSSNDLTMELGGTALGTGYDHLTVKGTAFLGGALDVVDYGGFKPGAGESFDLFDGTLTGAFSSVTLPALGGGLSWDASALYTMGIIRVVPQAVPEPAAFAPLALGLFGLLPRRRD